MVATGTNARSNEAAGFSQSNRELPVRTRIRSDADRAEIETRSPFDLIPARTVYECLKKSASENPDKVAIVDLPADDPAGTGRETTYRELLRDVERAASLFTATSAGEVPIVAVICPLLAEGLVATWGAEAVGVAVPVNPFLKAEGVISVLSSAKANILVIGTPEFGPGAWTELDAIRAGAPGLKGVFEIGRTPAGDRDFKEALAGTADPEVDTLPFRKGDQDGTYMPTGGTTGAPKLVRQKQELQVVMAWLMGALSGSSRDEVVGLGMPNFHTGGLVCLCLRAMLFGQTLVILTPDGFRSPKVIADFWSIARAHRITSVIATPTSAAALAAAPDGQHEGNVIHSFGCGGSTIPTEVLHAFHSRFGIWLRELWGMTEFHGVTTGHPDDGQQPAVGSVGRRFAFHDVKAVELDGTRFVREVERGDKGILIARGICIGTGYVDTRADEELFVTGMPDGEVWQTTGDIGTVEPDGHVSVFGREKDLINRGGHKIDPREIEEVLQRHPAVQLSAAVGRPDPSRGELPIAYVQLKAGQACSPEELASFCLERIPERAAAPSEIVLLTALPMTAVGKIAKPALRVDAMRRALQATAAAALGRDDVPSIEIDESGRRPAAVLSWPRGREVSEGARQRLKDACRGFAFEVRV